MSDLLTIRQIAQFAHRKVNQLLYVVRSRKIEPTLHMGNVRLFNPQAAQMIVKAAAAIDDARHRGVGVNRMVVRPVAGETRADCG